MIVCVTVPYFAAAVERRDDTRLVKKPLVIGGQPWESQPVYAFSREVARKGVEAGMPLRLAHVLSPHSHFMPATQPRYFQASGEIVDLLTDFTPLLEPEDLWQPARGRKQVRAADGRSLPARYLLDLENLPLHEAIDWAQEIGREVRRQTDLAPAIGLARGKFAAQVAASLTRPNRARPVPPDEEGDFLAARSISFIPLHKKIARRLRLLGIHTLGQLAALPLSALRAQFGPELEPFHRLARGEAADPVQPLAVESVERVARQFDPPLVDRLTLERILTRMAAELAGRLKTAGQAGRSLALAWETETDAGHQAVTLRQPTAEDRRLAEALHELARLDSFAGGVTALTVTLSDLSGAAAQQLALFEPIATDRQVQQTLHNVAARHGGDCLYQAELVDEHSIHPLPERRFQLQALAPV